MNLILASALFLSLAEESYRWRCFVEAVAGTSLERGADNGQVVTPGSMNWILHSVGIPSHRLWCCNLLRCPEALICESDMTPVLSPIGILHSVKNKAQKNQFFLEKNTYNK